MLMYSTERRTIAVEWKTF